MLDPAWDEDNFDVTDLMAKLRLYNNRVLINQWVSSDDKNSDVNIIQVRVHSSLHWQTGNGKPSSNFKVL